MKKLFLAIMLVIPFALSAQKYGHINSQELFAQMPELKALQAQIDTLSSTYESQIAVMSEEYQKKIADYQANEATMTDGVKQFRQQEIAEMEQRIQLFYQTAQQDIQRKQQELIAPVQEKMVNAIKTVAEREGYTYIFDAAVMLYIAPDANNVIEAVKKELGIK